MNQLEPLIPMMEEVDPDVIAPILPSYNEKYLKDILVGTIPVATVVPNQYRIKTSIISGSNSTLRKRTKRSIHQVEIQETQEVVIVQVVENSFVYIYKLIDSASRIERLCFLYGVDNVETLNEDEFIRIQLVAKNEHYLRKIIVGMTADQSDY
ncbi:hypothetical protein RCL1_004536 [Eukaryota sp. TZLM3-RCL]